MPASRQVTFLLGDVDRLRLSPTAGARTETAAHVAALLASDALSAAERKIAFAVLETLARDIEQEVRRALAIHVAHCAILPATLARKIAEDIEAISVPFIRASPVLRDEDLLAIIASGGVAKQIAIAQRTHVSESVSKTLIGTGNAAAVLALLQNDGAQISEHLHHKIMDKFVDVGAIQDAMAERTALPLTIIQRLIQTVSETLRERLIQKHGIPTEYATDLLAQARERTLLKAASVPRASDIERFIDRLNRQGELTPTLLMRALCEGDIHFFEAGMATLSGIPLQNSVELIADHGSLGFKSLYERSGLPPEFFRAFRAALDVLAQLRVNGNQSWGPTNLKQILDRVVREYDEACPADLEYLLSQMSQKMLGRAERQWR
jgi:uncharacterized protein (DUF2336 family)